MHYLHAWRKLAGQNNIKLNIMFQHIDYDKHDDIYSQIFDTVGALMLQLIYILKFLMVFEHTIENFKQMLFIKLRNFDRTSLIAWLKSNNPWIPNTYRTNKTINKNVQKHIENYF